MSRYQFYLIWTLWIEVKELAQIQCTMFDNLNDPVTYLYNLLLWQDEERSSQSSK